MTELTAEDLHSGRRTAVAMCRAWNSEADDQFVALINDISDGVEALTVMTALTELAVAATDRACGDVEGPLAATAEWLASHSPEGSADGQ